VRRGELACRNSWGGDLFSSKDGDDESRVEPTIDPVAASDAHRAAPIDDEVTSVVTPPIRRSPDEGSTVVSPDEGTDEDRVVSDQPAPRRDNQRDEPDNRNDAARNDQDERARLIARGNSDALAHARERLIDRKRRLHVNEPAQASDPVDVGDDDVDLTRTETFVPHDRNRESSRQSRYFQRFGKTGTLKSEALPGDPPVPRAEVLRRQGETPSPDRYESIPEVDPGFDLPGWRKSRTLSENDTTPAVPPEQQPTEPSQAAPDSTDTSDENDYTSSGIAFEHTLNRARRIRGSKRPFRSHTVRVDAKAPGPRSAAQPSHPTSNVEDHAAAYLPDMDESDGSDLEFGLEATSDVHEQVPASVYRERRPGWLEQFGIRRSARRDQPRTSHHDSRGDDDVDDDQKYADESDRPLAAQHFGTLEPLADVTDEEENSDVTYIPNTPASRDDNAGDRTSQQSRYILPDLDEVFAERASANFYEPDVREYERTSPHFSGTPPRRVAPDLVSGDDEQRDVGRDLANRSSSHVDNHADAEARDDSFNSGSRWSRESSSSSSPRESWFRARRFQEWGQSQDDGSLDHAHSAQPNGEFTEAAPAGSHHGTTDHHSLPDLDASGFDVRDIADRGGELLDMTINIAPDIPRACRSCRSFQSADGGVRGWCTNEWAFTHRRMVNEDDLACDCTIGCWWLPDDRYWHGEPEISWALATPLIDTFIATRTRSPRRKTSGE